MHARRWNFLKERITFGFQFIVSNKEDLIFSKI